jgi:PIN domain nuclease of toxin-antitoxin system
MKILLDTHTILWVLAGDVRLSKRAKSLYENSADIAFSVVSLWEIGIKLGLQRPDFALEGEWWDSIPRTLVGQGAIRLQISDADCREVARLPLHNRDPFDRMLIVQAHVHERAILSCDTQLDRYKIRRVW